MCTIFLVEDHKLMAEALISILQLRQEHAGMC